MLVCGGVLQGRGTVGGQPISAQGGGSLYTRVFVLSTFVGNSTASKICACKCTQGKLKAECLK